MEEIKNEVNETKIDENNDYIEAIKKMKETTVSKDLFEKKVEENKKLIDALVNGGQIESPQEKKVDINKLREELYGDSVELNNLQYAEKTLELRDALIAKGGKDPFLPWGNKIMPTLEDEQSANRVAEALRSCIEYAEGDSEVFTNELQRITVDSAPKFKRR